MKQLQSSLIVRLAIFDHESGSKQRDGDVFVGRFDTEF
jgi:hypothetical protein